MLFRLQEHFDKQTPPKGWEALTSKTFAALLWIWVHPLLHFWKQPAEFFLCVSTLSWKLMGVQQLNYHASLLKYVWFPVFVWIIVFCSLSVTFLSQNFVLWKRKQEENNIKLAKVLADFRVLFQICHLLSYKHLLYFSSEQAVMVINSSLRIWVLVA